MRNAQLVHELIPSYVNYSDKNGNLKLKTIRDDGTGQQ